MAVTTAAESSSGEKSSSPIAFAPARHARPPGGPHREDAAPLGGACHRGAGVWHLGPLPLRAYALAADRLSGARAYLLTGDLRREGVELVIARDVGQVRDVLRRAEGGAALPPAYPTVQDAVEAVAEPESPGSG